MNQTNFLDLHTLSYTIKLIFCGESDSSLGHPRRPLSPGASLEPYYDRGSTSSTLFVFNGVRLLDPKIDGTFNSCVAI